jgi:periplasmic protein TonB
MIGLRAGTVALSFALHGALIGWMLHVPVVGQESYEAGSGNDFLTVENAISIEGPLMVGDAVETIRAQEIAPTEAVEAPPPQEIKAEELTDVIKTTAAEQEHTVTAVEPKPEEPKREETPPPIQTAALALPEQVAIDTHASSGKAKAGGDPTLQRMYLGNLSKTLEKNKIFPKSRETGTVVVRFTVSPAGELLSSEVAASSGSPKLDEAAVRSLAKSAPFPPMPVGASNGPLVVSVPFRYIAR